MFREQEGSLCGWSRTELREVIRPALQGLVGHSKEFGFCCKLHGKPLVLLESEGDVVSFSC